MSPWYVVPYKIRPGRPNVRYCAMDDFTALIEADGGKWSESEVLGNIAVVKVNALPPTLAVIDVATGFFRCPVDDLSSPLATVSNAQATALRQKLLDLGYPSAEIAAALGNNIRQRTLGDVLRFAATRRLKGRFDAVTQTIILDGPVQVCKSVDTVNAEA